MFLALGEEYSFIVLADTHITDGDDNDLGNIYSVIENNRNIKFAVVVGDITQSGSTNELQRFIDIANTLRVPFYPVIGNHDLFFNNWQNWKSMIGSTMYRIDADTATLFILDSANAFFGNYQLNWLERELKTAQGRVFVFTHTNLFIDNLTQHEQITDVRERARIVSILRDGCDYMFMGHIHRRIPTEVGGVKYLSLEDFKKSRHYCLVTVNKTGISYHFEGL
jgi:predicted phosphodiesterase